MGCWVLFAIVVVGFCSSRGLAKPLPVDAGAAFSGKKVLWVDSYHPGYQWTSGLGRGIEQVLAGSGVELKVWHMDTKRNTSAAYGRRAGQQAKEVIDNYRPDVVIASDDNAQKYLVLPYLMGGDLPVVFCGVDGDPAEYGYPGPNVTGMREVDLFAGLTEQMRVYAGGEGIGLLVGDTATARIAAENYQRILGGRMKTYLVRTWTEFQQAFIQAQREVDMLCLRNNAGIQDWNDDVAENFLAENVRVPTGSVHLWMKTFVVFCLAKQPEEQGVYAAEAALRILAGLRPENMPIVQNREARLIVNLKMAQAAGIVLPVKLLQTAEIIGQEALRD